MVKVFETQTLKNVDAVTLNEVLAKLETKKGGGSITILPAEVAVLKNISKVEDFKSKCQLSPKNKTKLKKSVKRYIESLNITDNLSPGKALLATLAIVEGPLLLPVAMNYFNDKIESYSNDVKPVAKPVEPVKK
jgi:hypothetical protein